MLTVERCGIAVIKGAAARQPDHLELTTGGAAGDRRFYVKDDDEVLVTARRTGRLLLVQATLDPSGDVLSIAFPGGGSARARIERGDAVTGDVWGRETKGWGVRGPFDTALSAFLGFGVSLIEVQEPGAAQDDGPLSLISTASIDELRRRGGLRAAIDSRRFRMNLEVAGCSPFEEESWAGRRLEIGSAVIEIGGTVPRCVVTSIGPASGERDLDVLRLIASRGMPRDQGLPLGVFAQVIETGVVVRGDVVSPW